MSRSQAHWLPAGDDHLLLTAALHADDRGVAAWAAVRPRFDLDRADGEQVRVLPLVLRTLAETGTSDPDQARMAGLRRLGWMRSRLVMWSAAEAIGALTAAGIDAMALKGTVLAATAYDQASLRPMVDADLLVRPVAVPAAVDVLRGLGYDGRVPDDRRYTALRHGLGYGRPDGASIDLHWMPHRALALPGLSRSFPRLPWEARLAADEWWDRARTFQLGGVDVRAPAATDMLLHVCLHGAFGGRGSRLRWVADAAAVLRAEGPELDWAGLVDQAGRRQVTRTLGASLGYLLDAHDLPVPRSVVEALAGAPVGLRARTAERCSTRPLPRHTRVAGDLPNTMVRYLLLTRQDPAFDAVRGLAPFLATGWGVDAEPRALARATLAKLRSTTRR